jgi:hypothetical protein
MKIMDHRISFRTESETTLKRLEIGLLMIGLKSETMYIAD